MSKEAIQILNISNVNKRGETVLNDSKLLELITLYPFLYNPRVKAYNDPDYTRWAWKRINADFNFSYKDDPRAAFSVDDLVKRWEVLKPLVRCLSNDFDLKTIPLSLRDSVIKIGTNMEENPRKLSPVKKKNCAQVYLMEQMEKIAKLPLEQQFALEQDMLNLILNEELNQKGVKLQEKDMQKVAEETEDILKEIGFQEVFNIAYKQEKKNKLLNSAEPNSLDGDDDDTDDNFSVDDYNTDDLANKETLVKPCCVRMKRLHLDD